MPTDKATNDQHTMLGFHEFIDGMIIPVAEVYIKGTEQINPEIHPMMLLYIGLSYLLAKIDFMSERVRPIPLQGLVFGPMKDHIARLNQQARTLNEFISALRHTFSYDYENDTEEEVRSVVLAVYEKLMNDPGLSPSFVELNRALNADEFRIDNTDVVKMILNRGHVFIRKLLKVFVDIFNPALRIDE
jgi:hypothetical protein